jgi:hypothetical protein
MGETVPHYPQSRRILGNAWHALGGSPALAEHVSFDQPGSVACHFAVADLASGLMAAAGLAVAELAATAGEATAPVTVHRALATGWFHTAIEPQGWTMDPFWHPLCADYRARDGWIRLHTNIPSHERAALKALHVEDHPDLVAAAVAKREADELEMAVLACGGAAARMRTRAEWLDHPQGRLVQEEQLVHVTPRTRQHPVDRPIVADRPLAGVRVLDLTRGVAGPVATRCLAAFGADVLRIDPIGWEEPAVVPDVSLGKRRARLDLRSDMGRAHLKRLISQADILVHGYRPGALAWLQLDDENQEFIPPGLIDVMLNAYGWAGPWSGRRGFDSLVQMSSGMSHEAMVAAGSSKPVHLPMQALDQGTGYLMAAAAIRAFTERLLTGRGRRVRCSLARTAELLIGAPRWHAGPELESRPSLFAKSESVYTGWGRARRLPAPIAVERTPMRWEIPAGPLGSDAAEWPG